MEDRSIFLKDVKEHGFAFQNKLGEERLLHFKPVIPREIAVQSDMLGSFIYLLHRELDNQEVHHAELIKNYNSREVCLYDVPFGFYVDGDGSQNLTKVGGSFAILGKNIQQICDRKKVKIDIGHLIKETKRRFPDRELKIM